MDRGGDVLHCVIDGQTGGYAATWGINVERDGLVWVVGFEKEELGDYAGAVVFFDLAVQADDAFFQKTTEDVLGVPTSSLVC